MSKNDFWEAVRLLAEAQLERTAASTSITALIRTKDAYYDAVNRLARLDPLSLRLLWEVEYAARPVTQPM